MMNPIQTTAEPTLTIRRTFAAPRARVFAAWTSADLVRQWLAPSGNISALQWDARDGGTFRVAMHVSNGEEFVAFGAFSEVRPPELLKFTFSWQEDDPADEHETSITVELHERGVETEMVFTQERLRNEASRDSHAGGWDQCFANLARVLTG